MLEKRSALWNSIRQAISLQLGDTFICELENYVENPLWDMLFTNVYYQIVKVD